LKALTEATPRPPRTPLDRTPVRFHEDIPPLAAPSRADAGMSGRGQLALDDLLAMAPGRPVSEPASPGDRAPTPPPPSLRQYSPARTWRSRIRIGLAFAFLVSLLLHSSLLALFVGGTAPGTPEGREAISVDVITQEQYDLLVGNGSSQGGKPRKVDDNGDGTDQALQHAAPSSVQKATTEAEQREAPSVVTSADGSEQMPSGSAERMNPTASEAPRKPESKGQAKGSAKESEPARRTDPKEQPDSEREDARTEAPPADRKPGAEGGATRRNASRGGVGEQLGPLPPTMRQALMQQLQKQIERCYVPPAGMAPATELPLVLIRFHKDGSLNGAPRSLRYERTAGGKAMAKAAIKAVGACAPYRMPPRFASYYDDWKEIRAEFEFASR